MFVCVGHCLPFLSSYLSAKHALTKIAKGIIKVCKEDVSCPFLVSLSHAHTHLYTHSYFFVMCIACVRFDYKQ